jgi:hypothetical protein
VAFRAALGLDAHAAEDERQPFRQAVRVLTDADSEHSSKFKVQSSKLKDGS